MAFYSGYNTINNDFGSVRLTDVELVKRDILNHFSIVQGEKLMNPNFGTNIKTYVFEPLTPELEDMIIEEIQRVIQADPRVMLENLTVQDSETGVSVAVSIQLVNSDVSEQMYITFDRNTQTVDAT